ncbi:hypothetical protein LINPERPRIM_LOCUS37591, partial [Linum perenne]
ISYQGILNSLIDLHSLPSLSLATHRVTLTTLLFPPTDSPASSNYDFSPPTGGGMVKVIHVLFSL